MNKAIHGAFRRDLDRFIEALAVSPAGDRARARQLTTAWANFDDQLTHHHEGEHEIAWPALLSVGVSAQLLEAMDAEHDTMAAALSETRAAMSALSGDPSAEQAATARSCFEQLRTVTVQHLDHEEAELEPVYQAKRDTPEIKAMGRAFGKTGMARGGRFFAWVLDGASPAERAAVTSEVPGPVLAIIGGIFGRGYRKDVAPVWAGSARR
ncbi:Hemerythrin HHE cation binding domain-containing protein [Pedococcus dokdonensis]|uniref:Hemerythrin HHE cation binding domain-containing protein n=2 Tax=Pedococcus dokdonensis TaxID=443156 RepID=A0A1H0N996_9MICO|nr:Hemerythrin HHE cation binding domain-containing protein [Pedococcus dokdonensis]